MAANDDLFRRLVACAAAGNVTSPAVAVALSYDVRLDFHVGREDRLSSMLILALANEFLGWVESTGVRSVYKAVETNWAKIAEAMPLPDGLALAPWVGSQPASFDRLTLTGKTSERAG